MSVVESAFKNDAGFMGALDKACRDFINRNALCKSSSKSPELLARYSDSLLKKSARSEESELDAGLADIMTVFKYLEDKDVFQKFYSKMLAKRLVYDASVSEDGEASMITRLKEACGFEYTNKLSKMFTDMSISKDLNQAFKERVGGDWREFGGVDFYIKVLATGAWPLQAAPHASGNATTAHGSGGASVPTMGMNLPKELEKVYSRFQQFYTTQHSGRKLTWLFHLSHGELKTHYLKAAASAASSGTSGGGGGGGGGYIFMVYTYAMAILLAFNDAPVNSEGRAQLSVQEVALVTGLSEASLSGTLAGLLKAKVLLASGGNADAAASGAAVGGADEDDGDDGEEGEDKPKQGAQPTQHATSLDPSTHLILNPSFRSKKIRVNLKISLKSSEKSDLDETHRTIEEDRRLLIQAAIVRIMKTRRQLKHVQLVQEVIVQVGSRFRPKVGDIKKCVDVLLEKEYLERVDGQRDLYNYVA